MTPMIPTWKALLTWPARSIRRKLGLGIALIYAAVMTVFVVDLTTKQHTFLRDLGLQRAETLARVVAVNSVSWVAAGDVQGLGEVIGSVRGNGHILYAMVVDLRGQVLAHTEGDKVGLFLTDDISRHMLTRPGDGPLLLADTSTIIDMAVPVKAGARMMGWVRVALDQQRSTAALRDVVTDGAIHIVVAITAGALFAFWVALRLTRDLGKLSAASERLRRGEEIDLPAIESRDEVGALAETFQAMAQTIQSREAELRSTIDKLATSNSELERFAHVASHDLQEPLRTIVSYGQLMDRRYRGKLDADADEFIHFMTEASMRLHGLVQALLQVSRVGSMGGAFQPVALDKVLADVTDNLRDAVEASGARITASDLPVVRADPSQMIQLFQNLIANAIKFHRPGQQPSITLDARRDGAMWEITVADDGIGVAPEHVEDVFLIFRRLHAAGEYPGSGVGLAVCRRIVDRHGGRIRCVPRAEGGVGFVFTLPDGAA